MLYHMLLLHPHMLVGFFFFLFGVFIIFFSMRRCSIVDLPSFPPACASVMSICFRARLLMILSYTFPTLLATVIPRSFENIPFLPFPLYSLVIVPICHCWSSAHHLRPHYVSLSDLRTHTEPEKVPRIISYEEGARMAQRHKMTYFEISSMNNVGVSECFNESVSW